MTSRRPTPFTVGPGIVASWEGTALVQLDARSVPMMLHRLEVYKLRFPYSSDEDFLAGYQFHTRAQEELLMDIGDRLILEVRAMRGGGTIPPEARDPQADPFELPLSTLGGIIVEEARSGDTLEAIRLLVEQLAGAQDLDEIKATVAQIALLLA